MSEAEESLRLTMKLPESRGFALLMPFAQPTAYGLGKSGWITATFGPKDSVPVPMLLDWMEESFSAVAPKRLAASLLEQSTPAAPKKRR